MIKGSINLNVSIFILTAKKVLQNLIKINQLYDVKSGFMWDQIFVGLCFQKMFKNFRIRQILPKGTLSKVRNVICVGVFAVVAY